MKKSFRYLNSFSPHTIRAVFLGGLSLFFLGLFLKLTSEIREDDIIHVYDRQILEWLGSLRSSATNGPAIDITALGSPTVLTLLTISTVSLLLTLKNYLAAIYLTLASIGAGIGTILIKDILGRERPTVIPKLVEISGLSYPSGHSFGASAFYFSLAVILASYLKHLHVRVGLFVFASLFIGLIGISRLYLGVHYPSDVLSGIFLGMSWSLLLAGSVELARNKLHRHR
jgi:membrane-associated phospholipid phosphatase